MKNQPNAPQEKLVPASTERKTDPIKTAKIAIAEEKPSLAEKDMLTTVKGGSILMVGRLFNYASRLVVTFILARLLGAEQYGLYNLAVTAATVSGAMAVFGLDSTTTRYIAILNAKNDRAGVWGVIQVALGTTLVLGVAIGAVLFILADLIASQLFHEPGLAPLLRISALVVPFLGLSDVLAGATRGFKNMRDTVIAQNIAQPAIRLVLLGAVALLRIDVVTAVITFGIADVGASIILLFFLHRRFSLVQSLTSGRRNFRDVLTFTFPLWLSDMLLTFRGNLQTLLLGTLYTVKGVGIFSIVNHVTLLGNIFHTSMSQSAKPLIAELHDQGKRHQLKHLYQTTTRWIVTLNVPIVLVIVLFPSQLISIFGRSFAEGAPALAIMGWVNLVHVATGMCGSILEMTGHNRIKVVNTFIRVSAAILANFLFIPRWGITGAAMAALVFEVISNVLPMAQLWFLYRLQPYNKRFFKPLLAGAVAGGTGLLIRLWLPLAGGLLETILHITLILAVYGAVLQLLGLGEEERTMMARLRRRAKVMLHL